MDKELELALGVLSNPVGKRVVAKWSGQSDDRTDLSGKRRAVDSIAQIELERKRGRQMVDEVARDLPASVTAQLVRLPYELSKYFNVSRGDTTLALALLRPTRVRIGGVIRANRLMRMAYDGKHPKREAIAIVREDEDEYKIIDGNSTYMNAYFSGWPDIVVKVVEDPNMSDHKR